MIPVDFMSSLGSRVDDPGGSVTAKPKKLWISFRDLGCGQSTIASILWPVKIF